MVRIETRAANVLAEQSRAACVLGLGQGVLERFMDKKIAGLLGAVAAVSTMGTAQAAPALNPTETLRANSFADLLEPIPNAAALLQAVDQQPQAETPDGNVQMARYHHHHHHHHHAYRRYVPRIIVVPRHRHHHHHHHHHHHNRY
jgi:hypothetical protein